MTNASGRIGAALGLTADSSGQFIAAHYFSQLHNSTENFCVTFLLRNGSAKTKINSYNGSCTELRTSLCHSVYWICRNFIAATFEISKE